MKTEALYFIELREMFESPVWGSSFNLSVFDHLDHNVTDAIIYYKAFDIKDPSNIILKGSTTLDVKKDRWIVPAEQRLLYAFCLDSKFNGEIFYFTTVISSSFQLRMGMKNFAVGITGLNKKGFRITEYTPKDFTLNLKLQNSEEKPKSKIFEVKPLLDPDSYSYGMNIEFQEVYPEEKLKIEIYQNEILLKSINLETVILKNEVCFYIPQPYTHISKLNRGHIFAFAHLMGDEDIGPCGLDAKDPKNYMLYTKVPKNSNLLNARSGLCYARLPEPAWWDSSFYTNCDVIGDYETELYINRTATNFKQSFTCVDYSKYLKE